MRLTPSRDLAPNDEAHHLLDPRSCAAVCEDILSVLEKHLIPSAESGESKVRLRPPSLATSSSAVPALAARDTWR